MRADIADYLAPQVRARLWAKAESYYERQMLAEVFAKVPRSIAPRLLDEWERRFEKEGRFKANWYVTSLPVDILPELFHNTALPFDATDDEIVDAAERAVKHASERIRLYERAGIEKVIAALERIAHRYRVDMPNCKTQRGLIARMLEKSWWRRALRKRFQIVEHAAIRAGCIHKRAAPYVSDEAMRRHERHARKTTALLEALEALNENTGEILSLADLRDTSTANPTIRRFAMMACVRGLEDRGKALGFPAVFLTITCPSRMHARLAASGDPNPRYDGTSPRVAQTYLARNVWNAAMRKLKHMGIAPGRDFFGLRTVEPHHDATPHWHVLAFVNPLHLDALVTTLRAYALADSPDEPGAAERRFAVKQIDPEQGSAVGYIAKYISKNTDGEGVGEDQEAGGTATGNAPRVVVWARLWHARQFQFFGVGAVSPFRELYRLDTISGPLEALLGDLWRAAREGDFAAYLAARDASQTRIRLLYEPEDSRRYPGEQVKRLCGITVSGDAGPVPIVTRPDRWRIQPAIRPDGRPSNGCFALPWTRFNNSASVDLTGFFSVSNTKNRVSKQALNRCRNSGKGRQENRPRRGTATPPGTGLKDEGCVRD